MEDLKGHVMFVSNALLESISQIVMDEMKEPVLIAHLGMILLLALQRVQFV